MLKQNAIPSLYTKTQEKKLLLKQMQPPAFKQEGKDVERVAKVGLDAMDD